MKKGILTFSPQVLRILALVVVTALIVLFFASQIENYLNGRLFNRISSSVAVMALIATGQTLIILTRNIDLSVGSIVGFTAFATGSVIANNPDLSPVLLVGYAALLGGAFGILNGLLVAYARIPSIIVTLATMALFRSVLVEYSNAKSVTSQNLPAWLLDFPNHLVFSLGEFQFRAGFMTATLVVMIAHIALTRLRPARQFYAVGSNPEAATMAGIDSRRVILIAFILSGVMAGLAGFMFVARFGNITVVAGLGFELKSIAAAVVGGVSINGGSGTVIGALLGTVLVDLIDNSLVRWPVVSEFWREAVLGAMILIAVAADTIFIRRLAKMRAARAHEAAIAAEGAKT
ncbi:MAG: ABC transporter permease [Tabrizicola sp.]